MSRQNLRRREIVIATTELHDTASKVRIDWAVEFYKRKKLIVTDENSIHEWEREQARTFFRIARQHYRRTGEIDLESINLFEPLPDGGRINYYKEFGELTAPEGAQHLDYLARRVHRSVGEYFRYYDPLKDRHGPEVEQLTLLPKPRRPKRKAG